MTPTQKEILKATAGEFYINVWEWQRPTHAVPIRFLGGECDVFSTMEEAVEGFKEHANDPSLAYLYTASDKGILDIRDYFSDEEDEDYSGDPAIEQQEIIAASALRG